MTCIGMAKPTEDDLEFGANRVEMYQCANCYNARTQFPRYNNCVKLLETRTGRCGEYANAFTLLLRALNYEARYVMDWTDNVWTEVWSEGENRWIHCDSCEASFERSEIIIDNELVMSSSCFDAGVLDTSRYFPPRSIPSSINSLTLTNSVSGIIDQSPGLEICKSPDK